VPPTLLSVDWDFFVYHGAHARVEIISPASGELIEIPGRHLYDWGTQEGLSDTLQQALWEARSFAFALVGLDLTTEHSIRPELGCTEPEDFLALLQSRYQLPPPAIADSHAFAFQHAYLFHDRGAPFHVISFDAHHDLGYRADAVNDEIADNCVSCESWLYHLLRTSPATTVEVVYPDWSGRQEWEESADKRPHLRPYHDRITINTFNEWKQQSVSVKPQPAEGLFLCRSGSWTPPWTDQQFLDFIAAIENPVLHYQDVEVRNFDSVATQRLLDKTAHRRLAPSPPPQ
jgi:hypothetical protein